MNSKYKPGQQVYFLICGRYVTKATVVASTSWFITIRFSKKTEDCFFRLPHNRLFTTEEEASKHIRPVLPPIQTAKQEKNEYICTRRWGLWE